MGMRALRVGREATTIPKKMSMIDQGTLSIKPSVAFISVFIPISRHKVAGSEAFRGNQSEEGLTNDVFAMGALILFNNPHYSALCSIVISIDVWIIIEDV